MRKKITIKAGEKYIVPEGCVLHVLKATVINGFAFTMDCILKTKEIKNAKERRD